jgi:TolA-binding protein
MTEPNPPNEEKKIKIKPRTLKAASPDEDGAEGEETAKPTSKLASRVQPTGMPFEPRAQSRPLAGAGPELSEKQNGDGPDAASTMPGSLLPDDVSEPSGSTSVEPAEKPVFRLGRWVGKTLQRRVTLKQALVAFAGLIVLVAWMFYSLGGAIRQSRMIAEIGKQGVEIPADFQAHLDAALKNLRDGDAEKALGQLIVLERENSAVSSLAYLVALAAMQNGDSEKALAKANESIAKKERVSDSLALKAVLETQKNSGGFGDPRVRAESYLRRAMVADAANPSPCIELATLLRYRGRTEEAKQFLEAARSRLNPVDSHAVVDTSLALMSLQSQPDENLPVDIHPDKDVAALFSAAYVAMRKGDFARAADLLRTGRERFPADLYYYLVNDPAMRKFVSHPEVAEFFR